MKRLFLGLALLAGLHAPAFAAAAPKRVLLITTTTGFRHSSIEIGEKVIRELAAKSGEFVIVSTSEHPDYPNYGGGRGGGRGAVQVPGASPAQQAAIAVYNTAIAADVQKVAAARTALVQAAFNDRTTVPARAADLAAAELALATARANAFAAIQGSANRLTRDQSLILAGLMQPPPGPSVEEQVRKVLATYMSPQSLATFDGIYFNSTVGELPIPDKEAFFKWIADGHAVMGNHAASDSLHQTPEYAVMLGGQFARHGQQAVGKLVNFDAKHPATSAWGPVREVFDELYLFRPNYDRTKVHSLLSMVEAPADGRPDPGAPGWFPVAWTKMYGKGRVFFTSLGHREDVWDPKWTDAQGQRRNAPEVAEAFQAHLLGGMRWALGLAEGDVTPQPVTP